MRGHLLHLTLAACKSIKLYNWPFRALACHARLASHLWRASDGTSTRVILARDAATQDWFTLLFFCTATTLVLRDWRRKHGPAVLPLMHSAERCMCKTECLPHTLYRSFQTISWVSLGRFPNARKNYQIKLLYVKKPAFLLTLHTRNQISKRGKNVLFLDFLLLLILLGSYEGEKISFCQRERIDASSFDVSSCSEWGESGAERQEPVGLERSSMALVRNSKGEHLHETFIRYDKRTSAIKQLARWWFKS